MKGKSSSQLHSFRLIEDVAKVVPLLERRLPKSCHVYNTAKLCQRGLDTIDIYALNGETDNDASWILATHYREDFGLDILISADEQNSMLTADEACDALESCAFINWDGDQPFCFVSMHKWIGRIIYKILAERRQRQFEVHPANLFYMPIEDCLLLREDQPQEPSIEVRRIDPEVGVEFVVNNWFYARQGTKEAIKRFLVKNESAGVYLDGKLVSGVIFTGYGIVGMLVTLKEHRNKGYAKLCMKHIFRELAKAGMIPAMTVESQNKVSSDFHKKLGCTISAEGDWFVVNRKVHL